MKRFCKYFPLTLGDFGLLDHVLGLKSFFYESGGSLT